MRARFPRNALGNNSIGRWPISCGIPSSANSLSLSPHSKGALAEFHSRPAPAASQIRSGTANMEGRADGGTFLCKEHLSAAHQRACPSSQRRARQGRQGRQQQPATLRRLLCVPVACLVETAQPNNLQHTATPLQLCMYGYGLWTYIAHLAVSITQGTPKRLSGSHLPRRHIDPGGPGNPRSPFGRGMSITCPGNMGMRASSTTSHPYSSAHSASYLSSH
ncbi:hypothetical protein B0T24DRAFT_245973 [Lasiosphaeria ovina]|uniref:Uncharacterized protein n=1 Tax=Lasiosphaeria ovina TaxID=92902 RepID=A0AAE0KBB6_9PEZI|nr:hypothetical protein B0T24DRAFT_245973 [Lasiosphaeria ovina]